MKRNKLSPAQVNELERDNVKKRFKNCISRRCHPASCRNYDSCQGL